QYGLSAVQRVENIKGAFSVADDLRADEIVGKHVLLVDDIFTTGATIAECARVLRKAGAAEVVSWTLASDRQ
ncbi:MAG: ComF family protein, partial [Schwartzia sp.]|nr:ComF family protein [Schwartzia sp. (in: firmicutes)]